MNRISRISSLKIERYLLFFVILNILVISACVEKNKEMAEIQTPTRNESTFQASDETIQPIQEWVQIPPEDIFEIREKIKRCDKIIILSSREEYYQLREVLEKITSAKIKGVGYIEYALEDLNKNRTILIIPFHMGHRLMKESYYSKDKEFLDRYLCDEWSKLVKEVESGHRAFKWYMKNGQRVLLLEGRDIKEIKWILREGMGLAFKPGSEDSDKDGLPDYYEKNVVHTDVYSIDTDKDGLTDYEEIFKYKTDPVKYDTDSDGVSDSNWEERREYVYTIRVIEELHGPYNLDEINDMFQDVKVLEKSQNYLKFEAILYPYSLSPVIPRFLSNITYDNEIKEYLEYLECGFFTNCSEEMIKDMETLKKENQIETDLELAEYVADYAMGITKVKKEIHIPPLYRIKFVKQDGVEIRGKKIKVEYPISKDDITLFKELFFADEMYKNKVHGACTSTSIYMAGIYRSAGIPSRIISTIPIIDYQRNYELISNIENDEIKKVMKKAWERIGNSYASHRLNEIYIGGRWIRADYSRIGVNNIGGQGPIVKVDSFAKFSEDIVNAYTETYGRFWRVKKQNPYNAFVLEDKYPSHA